MALLDQGKREVKEKEQSTFSRQKRFAEHILPPPHLNLFFIGLVFLWESQN